MRLLLVLLLAASAPAQVITKSSGSVGGGGGSGDMSMSVENDTAGEIPAAVGTSGKNFAPSGCTIVSGVLSCGSGDGLIELNLYGSAPDAPASGFVRIYGLESGDGLHYRLNGGNDVRLIDNTDPEVILFPLFNGGSALAASSDNGDRLWVRVPFSCDITSVEMTADQSGSVVVDIWKDTYANWPPTDADSITASAPPTISAATKSQDTTLTSWTTQVNAGDYLMVNIDSASTVTNAQVAIQCVRD